MSSLGTLRTVFITILITATITGATWYWLMVKPRDLLIEQKNAKITQVNEQLRVTYDQLIHQHATCDDQIRLAVAAAESKIQNEWITSTKEIKTIKSALANLSQEEPRITSERESLRSLNDQLKKNLESCVETVVAHSMKKRILKQINGLNYKKATLTNDRLDYISKINEKIPKVAELEERCKTANTERSKQVCVPAARERMKLNLAIKVSDEIQTEIRRLDEQVLVLQSKL